MLRLNLSHESQWLDLGHGVEILVAPMTTALMMAARKEAQGQITLPEKAVSNGSELPDAAFDTDEVALAMAKAVARIAIQDWKGVGDDNGFSVPVSPEGIDALLDIWPIFEAFQTKYVARAMILDAEKNVSPPLPTGSSAGAATTAKLRRHVPGLPAKPECATHLPGLAGLGPGAATGRPAAGVRIGRDRLGHGRGAPIGRGAGYPATRNRRTAAAHRGGDGAQDQ